MVQLGGAHGGGQRCGKIHPLLRKEPGGLCGQAGGVGLRRVGVHDHVQHPERVQAGDGRVAADGPHRSVAAETGPGVLPSGALTAVSFALPTAEARLTIQEGTIP